MDFGRRERWRDGDGERRQRPGGPFRGGLRGDRADRPERPERPDRSERPERLERQERFDRSGGRSDRGPGRPASRREPIETLDRIESRPQFEPKPPEWGRPPFHVGQRVAWNFVYKLANSNTGRGTIVRVGETCDVRWDDGLETVFMPPVVIRELQEDEEAGQSAETLASAGPEAPEAAEG